MVYVTLSQARKLFDIPSEHIAEHCGVSIQELARLEDDPGRIEFEVVQKLFELYGNSFDQIYFGSKADCIRKNRLQLPW